jgi:hypothetical protein
MTIVEHQKILCEASSNGNRPAKDQTSRRFCKFWLGGIENCGLH